MAVVDPIVTGEAEGPPTPDELRDREIADPETPDQAAEAATLDPSTPLIDQTVAASAPPVGTAVGQGSPAAAAPTTPTEAGAGSFAAGMEAAGHASDKAQHENEISDVDRQRLAQQAQEADDQRVQREMDALAQADARSEYQKKIDAADEKVRDFKFHDYYDNPRHQSRVLDKFAVFLGGLGNLGGQAPGSPNRALDSLENSIRADHEEQLAYLNSSKYLADKQREGYTDLLKQQGVDRQQAELDYANKKLATADKFAELAQTARGKANYDAAMIEVAKLKKSAYDDQQKVFSEIEREKLEEARARYLANKARRGSGAGAGGNAAFSAFTDAAGALKPGEAIPANVVALALKAGIKRDKIADQVKKYASGANPLKGKQPDGEIPKDAVVYGGQPIGLAPSGRGGAAGFTKSLISYDDSLESLEALKKHVVENPILGSFARGDAYNRAVLAIAATTTANPSDSTTKHEADTLKGLLRVSPEAIQTSINHIRERREALLGTLRPLPKANQQPEEAPHAVKQAQDRLERLGAVRIE